MDECNHCWHDTGSVLTSNPPQYQLICCWCGETKNVRTLPYMEVSEEHGNHAYQINIQHRKRSAKMSETVEQPKKLSDLSDVPTLTIEQISQQLNEWLTEHGVSLQVVATGLRSGQPSPIDDFLPVTHQATVAIVKVQKQ